MKVAIDCRSLRTSPTGIPNFLVAAINEIAQHNPLWNLYLLANDNFNQDLNQTIRKQKNINIVITPLKILPNYAIIWYFTKLESVLKKIDPDLFWAPAFLLPPFLPKKIRTLVTVHDMVYKEHKKTMSFMNRFFFDLLHDHSVKKADMLWTNSLYTKKGVDKYFPERKCQKVFIGFFINNDLFKPIAITPEEKKSILKKHHLKDKFLLFVGTLEPRKNLVFLLSLMPELAFQGYDLLVVGAKGWGKSDISNIVEAEGFPKKQVVFAGFLSTEELIKIYNMASVYVSTSSNEGFGMPQLEAMACGCPVVSPHNSAMIEVVEGAGETVKTWEKQDWLEKINQVYQNRDFYINAGFKRVMEYKKELVVKRLTHYINATVANAKY